MTCPLRSADEAEPARNKRPQTHSKWPRFRDSASWPANAWTTEGGTRAEQPTRKSSDSGLELCISAGADAGEDRPSTSCVVDASDVP